MKHLLGFGGVIGIFHYEPVSMAEPKLLMAEFGLFNRLGGCIELLSKFNITLWDNICWLSGW